MENMFCFQCEQTARGIGCSVAATCGKTTQTAQEQDILTCELISLAKTAWENDCLSPDVVDNIVDGLFSTGTNVNFDAKIIKLLAARVREQRKACGGKTVMELEDLFHHSDENTLSLRSILLIGLRGMAAYAHQARALEKRDPDVDDYFIRGMAALADMHSVDEWLELLMELGGVNLKCMALLDSANTEAYGDPVPAEVALKIEKGPFIVISGHDLHDLQMLLEQSEGRGVNIYTHGEMLPAHGYPELKKYPHLKGNFGTAWQSQQKEFAQIPAPVLFTTNCLMPPKASYADRVYTTSVVAYPEMKHIAADADGKKDFSGLIEHAIKLGGYPKDQEYAGINGGTSVITGYGRQTVLDNAPTIINAVKAGAIKHFFLVGGCDGAKPGRNYYTDFVKQAPPDTVILTLACGKFRFNDL
ncbi:MAG: hydroxylamine reductase, partial [Clostridiales bacterium]|nr:hydroxylamine reductase [Clostridiales bacterium]